jgi:hypothetical protein
VKSAIAGLLITLAAVSGGGSAALIAHPQKDSAPTMFFRLMRLRLSANGEISYGCPASRVLQVAAK